MKRAVLFLTVTLAVASSLSAQQQQGRALHYRVGDAMTGPVRSVRTERADLTEVDGAFVEGARRLVAARSYSPDGKRAEHESYRPDGSLWRRSVYLYADDGQVAEESHYDGGGSLVDKKIYARTPNETLTVGADGKVLSRVVLVRVASGDAVAEVLTYDGGGALVKRAVNTREQGGRKSIWTSYGPGGAILRRDENDLNYGGPHRTETQTYKGDGSAPARRVSTGDASSSRIEAVETGADGAVRRKTSDRREYDARRNLIKITKINWDEAAGKYGPSAVTYHAITYY